MKHNFKNFSEIFEEAFAQGVEFDLNDCKKLFKSLSKPFTRKHLKVLALNFKDYTVALKDGRITEYSPSEKGNSFLIEAGKIVSDNPRPQHNFHADTATKIDASLKGKKISGNNLVAFAQLMLDKLEDTADSKSSNRAALVNKEEFEHPCNPIIRSINWLVEYNPQWLMEHGQPIYNRVLELRKEANQI
tara:strand:+ start:556 stop:1122 length:567 start_codon:yes stop_codon:yes gene_type:complete